MEDSRPILTVVNAGGHLTQALCMMKVIKEFHLVTSIDIEADLGAKSVTVIKSTQFNVLVHFKNIFKAYSIIKKIKPAAIFSTGGPICIPFAVIAKITGIRFIYRRILPNFCININLLMKCFANGKTFLKTTLG